MRDRVVDVCTALCVFRLAGVLTNAQFLRLQQTCAEIVKGDKSTVKMDKNEDSGEDGGSGVLAMCHEHDYTRG